MASIFSGRIDLKILGTYASDIDLGNRSYSLNKTYTNKFTNGTGADEAQAIFTDTRTTSGNDDLDLAGGVTDAFGTSLTFTSIKTIIVKAADANTQNLAVGAAGSNEFASFFGDVSDKIIVAPGGVLCLTNPGASGFGVTAGTGDILRVASASGSQSYDVIIIGEI